MGGGDLNLKKSWHPHTIKNQEKVWKAEQAKTEEEKKLKDLRREIEDERNHEQLLRVGRESGVLFGTNGDDKKLDWMYKSSTALINRDEYLLGRKIDKSFEILQQEEKQNEQKNVVGVKQPLNHVEHECVPFSIRAYKGLHSSEQVDLQRKVMEDPLMLIKQREIESRRKILENPVKLKELHRILKTEKKLKTKKSKLKKSRKKSRTSSCSSMHGSDSDLDIKLAKKLKGGLLKKDQTTSMGFNLSKLLDSKLEKISQELDKAAGKSKHRSRKKEKSDYSDTNSNSDEHTRFKRRSRSLSKYRNFIKYDRNNSDSRDKERMNKKYDYMRSGPSEKRTQDCRSRPNSRSQYKTDKRAISRSVSRSKDNKSNQRSINPFRSHSIDRKKRNERKSTSLSGQRDKFTAYRSRSRSRKDGYRKKSKTPPTPRDKKYSKRSPSTSRVHTNRFVAKASKLRSPSQNQRSSSTTYYNSKLTEKEKQAKLNEMISNASWREEERTEVVRKHRETYAREEERHTRREFDKNFLNKEVKKALDNQTSVGSRLRANLNNIQRTSSAMDKNFARK